MQLVECISSSREAERPVALFWDGARLEIAAVLTSWRTPEELRFRVRTCDQHFFELSYRPQEAAWTIQPLTEGSRNHAGNY
jgi:hypothetical protein